MLAQSVSQTRPQHTFKTRTDFVCPRLALEDSPWLEGHEVNGQVVLPGAAYIAMVGEALRQIEDDATYSLRNVRIAAARVLEAGKTVELVTTLKPIIVDASEDSPWYTFTISSHDGTRWTRNCSGEVSKVLFGAPIYLYAQHAIHLETPSTLYLGLC